MNLVMTCHPTLREDHHIDKLFEDRRIRDMCLLWLISVNCSDAARTVLIFKCASQMHYLISYGYNCDHQ